MIWFFSFWKRRTSILTWDQACRESGAHSGTFPKLVLVQCAHTFSSWCFIFSWYIPYSKSFKCPNDVLVASQLVSTLESVMCRRVIWQNLPHIRGSFCQGHILSVMGHIFLHRTTFSVPGMIRFSLFHSSSSIKIYREWTPDFVLALNIFTSCIVRQEYF